MSKSNNGRVVRYIFALSENIDLENLVIQSSSGGPPIAIVAGMIIASYNKGATRWLYSAYDEFGDLQVHDVADCSDIEDRLTALEGVVETNTVDIAQNTENISTLLTSVSELDSNKADKSDLDVLENKFNSISDYITSYGSQDGWTYKKYFSGHVEMFKRISNISGASVQISYPFDLQDVVPYVYVLNGALSFEFFTSVDELTRTITLSFDASTVSDVSVTVYGLLQERSK